MTIAEYTDSVLHLIRARLRLKETDNTNSARHLRYLYQQALYGYEEFGKKYASQAAQAEYERLGNQGRIVQRQMREYRQFDKRGRRGGHVHLEHVYTGWMFDQALRRLPQDDVNEDSINQIVNANYAVAWITKDEDRALTESGYKSKRGLSLADALQVYSKVGIHLLLDDEAIS